MVIKRLAGRCKRMNIRPFLYTAPLFEVEICLNGKISTPNLATIVKFKQFKWLRGSSPEPSIFYDTVSWCTKGVAWQGRSASGM